MDRSGKIRVIQDRNTGRLIEREEGHGVQYRALNGEGRVAGWLVNTGHSIYRGRRGMGFNAGHLMNREEWQSGLSRPGT